MWHSCVQLLRRQSTGNQQWSQLPWGLAESVHIFARIQGGGGAGEAIHVDAWIPKTFCMRRTNGNLNVLYPNIHMEEFLIFCYQELHTFPFSLSKPFMLANYCTNFSRKSVPVN